MEISKIETNNKWIYLTGNCDELLNHERTICLELNKKNLNRII